MGVVGPEGLAKGKRFNALRCLTLPSVSLRRKGLRRKCLTSPYRLSPASTRRRMASGSDGLSGCSAIQVAIRASWSGVTRTMIGLAPVRGLPLFLILSIASVMGLGNIT